MTILGIGSITGLVGPIDNLLGLEPVIKARLAAQMPTAIVGDAASLADAAGRRLQAPGALVLFSGASVINQDLYGRDVLMEQRWTVVSVSRVAAEIVPGAVARDDAGDLNARVLNALLGWQPPTTEGPLKLVTIPAPLYVGSFLLAPLTFAVQINFVYNPFTEE